MKYTNKLFVVKTVSSANCWCKRTSLKCVLHHIILFIYLFIHVVDDKLLNKTYQLSIRTEIVLTLLKWQK